MSKKLRHLYEQFQPNNYQLTLDIDKTNLKFKGVVVVTGKKVGRPSQRITLHQRDLRITSAKVIKHNKNEDQEIELSRILCHKSYDEVRLHSKDQLYAGNYTLELEFEGQITDSMLGIYPSKFEYEGKAQTIIATQFESHYAREAFPCIDEPIAKATFDLTLTTDSKDVVLSNTPVSKQKTIANRTTTIFETTPKMSTYLLAFVTGPMHSVESKTKDGVIVRTWSSLARPKKELRYSVDEAVRVLEFFTKYFGVKYPLKKCDQVALPDFDAGAMENWGLITYREVALLSDPDNPSISSEQYISLVIAHELSHQWFGNLVTMKWWDDLWLNESFASIMEHIALDELHPSWRQWEFYTSTDVISTSNRDIYKDIQPVGVKVTDPELIDTLFDPSIVYAKGGRLLKMLREYIGEEAFRKGLNSYFKKHAYSNTSREDLWEAFSKSSNKNISKLMTPWIEQSGMPVVKINHQNNIISLSQKRFVLDEATNGTLWPIPLLASEDLSHELLSKATQNINHLKNSPILLNVNGSGHYFVEYEDQEDQEFLASSIANMTVDAVTRINLINDSLLLARGGTHSLLTTLKLISNCHQEDRDSVWALISRTLGYVLQLTEGHQATEDALKTLRIKLARDWYKKLGWEDQPRDNPNTKQLRHTMIAYMIAGEHKPAISEALGKYNRVSSITDIDAEIRPTILSSAVRYGSPDVIDKLIDEYQQASSEVQTDITSGLSSTKDPKVAHKVISKALGQDGFVRPQDIMRWMAMFLRNRHTRETIWEFMEQNWLWFEETLSKSKAFDFLPVYTANAMNDEKWQKRYHEFFEPKLDNKTLERNIKIGFADIEARVAWRKRDRQKIIDYFKLQH